MDNKFETCHQVLLLNESVTVPEHLHLLLFITSRLAEFFLPLVVHHFLNHCPGLAIEVGFDESLRQQVDSLNGLKMPYIICYFQE